MQSFSGSGPSALSTPKGMRLHIGIFGRRNAGKSSLLNALSGQRVSIVSETAGTTTDPVEKAMELPPLGPVLFIDTAGIDDEGSLGALRVEKTRQAMDRTDLALIAAPADAWGDAEESLADEFTRRGIPFIAVLTRRDLGRADHNAHASLLARGHAALAVSTVTGEGMDELRMALIERAPESAFVNRPVASDLVGPGETAVLVTPIDKEAPKGRLILPQVQTLRDLLDGQSISVVTTVETLPGALAGLASPPRLVITDSQAFQEVSALVPGSIPLTSFSILFSRLKGDLPLQAEGAAAVDTLKPGDRVLIAEACAHHAVEDDIGRVKIPRWLNDRAGGALIFDHCQGRGFPDDLSPYALVVHCGACTFNRRAMLTRIQACANQGVPVSNYGLVIAAAKGILERALTPFPEALARFRRKKLSSAQNEAS